MALLISAIGSINAKTYNPSAVVNCDNLDIIPNFAKDGKVYLYDYTYSDDDTYMIFDIINEDFESFKITTVPLQKIEYTYYYQERTSTYRDVYVKETDDYGTESGLNGCTIDEVLSLVGGNSKIVTLIDGTTVVGIDFWHPELLGDKYPVRYYQNIDGEWHLFRCWYEGDWGPYGEFGEAEEMHSSRGGDIENLYLLQGDGADVGYSDLTYGVFGKEICYIVPTFTKQEYSIETETYKVWGERAISSGYNVYNSTNELVCSIEVPQGFNGGRLKFAEMGGKKMIICNLDDNNDDEVSATAFYQIDENNNVSFVKMTEPKVSPRNPRQGERVTVSIDEQFAGENVSVNVVSADGQIVMKDRIRNGQSTLDIDTSRFKQGMYVVTVSGKGKTSEAAKIIVR